MSKHQQALNEMYAVLNDSKKWFKHKDLLQELVDKAIPMKPFDDGIYMLCPHCKEISIMNYERNFNNKYDYCHDCGQAIDWTDYE